MIDHAREILILTGPPGAGKTTAAAALAAGDGSAKVHLHADDFWHFIKHGAIPPYLPEAHQQNGVVLDALAGVAATYADGGYFVILDGIVGPWFLAPFKALSSPVHYIVLRPALDLAVARCQRRGGDTLTDPQAIELLHRQFSDLGPLEHHVLEADDDDPERMVLRVAEAVMSGSYRFA